MSALDGDPGVLEIDDGWFFLKKDKLPKKDLGNNEALERKHAWTPVKIPHDWDIKGPFLEEHESGESGGYAPCGIGWYKRVLAIPGWTPGKRVFLRFDGVYMRATFWLNGKKVHEHLYGYSPFEFEVTHEFKGDGNDLLVVKVDNSIQPSCRWYSGSGVYRRCWIAVKEPVYIKNDGIHVTTMKFGRDVSTIAVDVDLVNILDEKLSFSLEVMIRDASGKVVAGSKGLVELGGGSETVITRMLDLRSPGIWDVDSPVLYRAYAALKMQGTVIDSVSTRFGIRSIRFDGNGFFLNGRPLLLKGVCLHHDGGCVGAAVPPDVWRRRLKKLRSIGCNAIRTAHNPPAGDFLDLCDEMGFLVIDEFTDKWYLPSRKGDWGGDGFVETWEVELESFMRRDRNHPSVVLWSLGNEVPGISSSLGKEFLVEMKEKAVTLDPTRPVSVALSPSNVYHELEEMEKNRPPFLGELCDVICMNYMESHVPLFHERWPDKAIIITEAHHYYRNKIPEEVDLPSSPLYPECTERNPWYDVVENECCCGQFLWTGIEYLGEVRDPYPYHGRTNAPIRVNGSLKPQAGFHASVWLDKPHVHLAILDEYAEIPRGKPQFDFPKIVCHWNFEGREDEGPREAWTFTNCYSVELRLNGEQIGIKHAMDYPYNTMRWSVPFVPGTLEAIGRDETGRTVARHSLVTAGPPARVSLSFDRDVMRANGMDCVHVEISLVDSKGVLVQLDDRDIYIELEGPGRLIGVDSGDLSSFTEEGAYQRPTCKTYWGRALAIIQSTHDRGVIIVKVSGDGIEGASGGVKVA